MRTGVIVQARMTSARLPGKVLMPLAGRPVLARVLDRVARAEAPALVAVATSDDPSDDPVARFCAERGTPCVRGPLEDVLRRFEIALDVLGLDAFIRVSGDSPVHDAELVDRAGELLRYSDADVVTNVYPRRTFPAGASVEAITRTAAARAGASATLAADREHVTGWFYANPDAVRIESFEADADFGATSLTVDVPDDLERLEKLIAVVGEDGTWRDYAEAARQ